MASLNNTVNPKDANKTYSQFYNSATGHYIKRDDETGRILGVKKDGTPYKGVRLEEGGIVYKPNPSISKVTARKAEKAVLSFLNKRIAK